MPEQDFRHLALGEKLGVDFVALSFVRRAEDLEPAREHTRLPLIAKIEKPQAGAGGGHLWASDCVMVARGDLGSSCDRAGADRPEADHLVAGARAARDRRHADARVDGEQRPPDPRRGEDVSTAILSGADAVMLSQESAIGQYPVGAVAMLAAIAERTEMTAAYRDSNEHPVGATGATRLHARLHRVTRGAERARRAGLPDALGRSARLVSATAGRADLRPLAGRETVRRCGLMSGVQAASIRLEVTEELIHASAARVVDSAGSSGEHVGITAGLPSGKPGTTSLLQIQSV